jgi:hypothetical protein
MPTSADRRKTKMTCHRWALRRSPTMLLAHQIATYKSNTFNKESDNDTFATRTSPRVSPDTRKGLGRRDYRHPSWRQGDTRTPPIRGRRFFFFLHKHSVEGSYCNSHYLALLNIETHAQRVAVVVRPSLKPTIKSCVEESVRVIWAGDTNDVHCVRSSNPQMCEIKISLNAKTQILIKQTPNVWFDQNVSVPASRRRALDLSFVA